MRLHKFTLGALAVVVAFTMTALPSSADVVFDFREDTSAPELDFSAPFDGGNGGGAGTIGSAFAGFDDLDLSTDFDTGEPITGISVSVVDVIGQTGTRASAGAGHITNVSGQDALSVNDDGTGSITGSSDSSHFNPGEAVDLAFNQAVFLTNIELESFTAGDTFFSFSTTDAAGVTTTIALADSFNSIANVPLAANQTFTLSFDSTTTDTVVRVESFQVIPQVIPEPSSLALLAFGAAGLITRRKRA